MPTYVQLGFFGTVAPVELASTGIVREMPIASCECGNPREVSFHGTEWRNVPSLGRYVRQPFAKVLFSCSECEVTCQSCETVRLIEETSICDNCESCNECCECIWCERCESHVSDDSLCSAESEWGNYRCTGCCECYVCSRCPSGRDHVRIGHWFCGDCENCEDHCDCVRCSYCGELSDEICDRNGYCASCCDDGCMVDTADMEDLAATLSDVPTYVEDSVSKVGPYTFGVELEHNDNGVTVAREIMRCVGLSSWQAKEDGSLHASSGAEVVSPILRGEDGFAQMRTAMLALSANGGTVNHECGTHVHIGADDMEVSDIARLVHFYNRNVSVIDKMHPASRANAYYASNWDERDLERLDGYSSNTTRKNDVSDSQSGRYRKVNLHSLRYHGTIEFRQHAGTLNPRKLEAWVRFLFALCDCARFSDASGTYGDLASLLHSLRPFGLDDATIAYLSNRSLKLGSA